MSNGNTISVRNIRCQCGWSMMIRTKTGESSAKEHISSRLHKKVCSGVANNAVPEVYGGKNPELTNVLSNLISKKSTVRKDINLRQ